MRLLLELLIVAGLIAVAWEKSFQERLGDAVPMLAKPSPSPQEQRQSTARRALPVPGPTWSASSGAWMRDPNRKSALDRPTPSPPPQPPLPR